ncbi:MAG: helix-turn-helix domain-containing protein [Peptoniphilaceae bacterium]
MNFANRFKDLRKLNKLSQTDIANRYNIDRTTVGKWETGISTPNVEIIKDLAKYFNVTVDYLIGNSNSKNLNNDDPYIDLNDFPEGVKILRRANKELSPEAKKKMIEMTNLFIDSLKDKE